MQKKTYQAKKFWNLRYPLKQSLFSTLQNKYQILYDKKSVEN